MEKKNKKYYYIYKIVLLKGSLAGKYYYGQHSTNSLQDNYAGSGSILKDYYKKYRAVEGVTYTKEILKFYNDEKELDRAEEILIGDLWETDPNCLNKKPGGNRPPIASFPGELNPFYGKHHTEKTKAILREKNKGRIPPNLEYLKKYTYEKSPAVDQYSKDGKFIKSWNHLVDAAKTLKIENSTILEVCKGHRITAGKFIWRFKGDPLNKYKIKPSRPSPEKQKEIMQKIISKLSKPVFQYDLNGNFITEYESTQDVKRLTGIRCSDVCTGRRKTAGGYIWKYKYN